MLFNSLLFLFFFLIITSGYYLLPGKMRWIWLLLASCYFYMYFKPLYVLIILFTVVIDYFAGRLIAASTGRIRYFWLLASLTANIGVLVFFKYFDFIIGNINFISARFGAPGLPLLQIILPIGLSFHTFQAMSYTIEVYYGRQQPERHLGIYALYVLFYPQMVAGPIERPQHILPQLHLHQVFNKNNLISGVLLMTAGLFKKVVIADRLGLFVNPVFADPHHHSALDLLIGIYFFAIQIYCDFSGYSDIAVGAALTLGISLMRNFNRPYLAQNIAEFWTRWHISLSTWFRDYIYIPLGGNRLGELVTFRNILIVFLISGLWHGADWKYLVWGLIHGILLIGFQLMNKGRILTPRFNFISWMITFHAVCLAWIFFRARNLADAWFILIKLFSFSEYHYSAGGAMQSNEVMYGFLIIGTLIAGEWFSSRNFTISNRKKIAAIGVLTLAVYFLGIFSEAQFIYFQF